MDVSMDYVVSGMIIFLMVSFSLFSIFNTDFLQTTRISQEQFNPEVERLFDKILLSRGEPYDWGADYTINLVNHTHFEDFGLAYMAQSTNMYTVDVNKIMRLHNSTTQPNPLYMPPDIVGSLLGLKQSDHWDYGFRLYMTHALNISISAIQNITSGQKKIPVRFQIEVRNYLGEVAPNAYVKAQYMLFYYLRNNKTVNFIYSSSNNITDYNGCTRFDFRTWVNNVKNLGQEQYFVLVVQAIHGGVKSSAFYVVSTTEALELNVVGDLLFAEFNEEVEIPNGARHLRMEMVGVTSDLDILDIPIENATDSYSGRIINYGGKSYRVYQLAADPGQDLIFLAMTIKYTGKYWLAMAHRPPYPIAIDYRSHSFPLAGVKSVSVERIVHAGGIDYYARLTMWRMSE
ncbi:MAG: hypothetical protein QXJ17_07970 [Nitrososphaeria archaeon]